MRQWALIALKIAVSAALLYFATRRIHVDMISERLKDLDPAWLIAAVGIGLLQTGLGAARWQRITSHCGAAMPQEQALRFNLIAAFFNQVLPSTVGGDAARIVLAARAGNGWRTATYSVLLDRFIGVLALAMVVTAGLYWSFALIANPLGRLVLLAVGLGSLMAAAAFLALGNLPLLARWRLTRRLADLSKLARGLLFSRAAAPKVLLLSFVIHLMTAALAWSAARAVAAQLSYLDALLLVLPVMLIVTIPISIAGWGVRESTLVLAFSYAGLPESDGLLVSVLMGGAMFAVGILGGLVWLVGSDSVIDAGRTEQADAIVAARGDGKTGT
ncbi:MAG: flippase-like domain-containing protein [Xanthobacteraceae bacterium]|nr:flippase-like domain-containing protein [Xanthobacteraceae bacterium]